MSNNEIQLRPWYMNDDTAFRQLVEQADHRLTDDYFPSDITQTSIIRCIMNMMDDLHDGNLHCAIQCGEKVVGSIHITRLWENYNNTGILRLVLLPEYCGRGIGTEAVKQIVAQAFAMTSDQDTSNPRFHKIQAQVFGDHPAAVKVLETNGFQYEGILRKDVRKNGKVYDVQVYGIVCPKPMKRIVIM